jgi:hypothetical protein
MLSLDGRTVSSHVASGIPGTANRTFHSYFGNREVMTERVAMDSLYSPGRIESMTGEVIIIMPEQGSTWGHTASAKDVLVVG